MLWRENVLKTILTMFEIKSKFIIMFIIILLTSYLTWTVVLAYKYSPKYSYRTEHNSFFVKIATSLIQPVMEIFGNRKVTHAWHWQNYTPDYDYIQFGFRRDSESKRVLQSEFSLIGLLTNAAADLNGIKEVIVVKPLNYDGNWSLAYCTTEKELFCQKSTIIFRGEVKILNDGVGYTWGLDKDEKPIKLQILREIKVDQEMDLLFV